MSESKITCRSRIEQTPHGSSYSLSNSGREAHIQLSQPTVRSVPHRLGFWKDTSPLSATGTNYSSIKKEGFVFYLQFRRVQSIMVIILGFVSQEHSTCVLGLIVLCFVLQNT